MELNMPGWMVSPCSLKRYMTAPQQSAAKTEKYFALGGTGLAGDPTIEEMLYGALDRGINDATTLEQT